MASISERENREIEAANASGDTPVVFVQGLWLLPSSWANWAEFYEQAGYAPLTPDWPDDPETVEEARANPDTLAKKTLKQVADHTTEIINAVDKKPAVIGHSTGGLLAQMLVAAGCSGGNNASPQQPPSTSVAGPTTSSATGPRQLTDLRDIGQLRSLFNTRSGEPRLILLA